MMTEAELKLIQRDRSDMEWVTSTEQGRRCLWKILSRCGIYRSLEGSTDNMLKQEGGRQIGLYLLSLISDASEDRLFEMMKEAKNRSIEEKEIYDSSISGESDTINDIIGELPGYSNDSGPAF